MIDQFLTLYNQQRRKQITHEEAARKLGITVRQWGTARMLTNTSTLRSVDRYIKSCAIPQANPGQEKQEERVQAGTH